MLINKNIASSKFINFVCMAINFIFGYYFLIDMVAGFLHLNNFSISLSVPFKTVLLILMLLVVCNNINILKWLIFFMAFSFLCLLHILSLSSNYTIAVNNLFKLFYCPVMYLYFDNYLKNENSNLTYRMELKNSIFFLLNMMLGILGYGYDTYSRGMGIKGFFYSGNELGIVVFCLFVFTFIKYENNFIVVILYSIIAMLIGMKSPLFAIWIFYLFVYITGKGRKRILGVLGSALVVIFVFVNRNVFLNLQSVQYHLNNLEWRMSQNDSLLNSLLSGRISYCTSLFDNMKENFNVRSLLFGYGVPLKTAEIDPFDTLYTYGIIMLFFQLYFYIKICWKNRCDKRLFFFNLIYFLLAIMAGHVWFNTTSIIIFCMINTCLFKHYRRKFIIRI